MTENIHEHMEHVSHSAHAGKFGMHVGLTMAFLGVLLALSAAMVGGERTELIATMVCQTNAAMKYESLSTKYRVLLSQLRQLHALEPDPSKFQEWDTESKKLAFAVSSPDESKLAKIIRLENAENLNAEIPTRDDLLSFVALVKAVKQEQEAACEWVESFRAAIQIHSRGAEQFEWAQLVSEIGIVIASLALLFNSRMAWYGALLLVVTALMILGTTYLRVSVRLHGAEESIHDARAHFESTNTKKSGDATDEELINSVEKDRPPLIDP